jgi:hypothetical protein
MNKHGHPMNPASRREKKNSSKHKGLHIIMHSRSEKQKVEIGVNCL